MALGPIHGGVLWDLAYHYLTLWHQVFGEHLSLVDISLGFAESPPISPSADTSAQLRLVSVSGIPFTIKVSKYYEGHNERWFRILGQTGSAIMTFSNPNFLTIDSQGKRCFAYLEGNYYTYVGEAFRRFVEDASRLAHGIEAAKFAIHLLLEAKRIGHAGVLHTPGGGE